MVEARAHNSCCTFSDTFIYTFYGYKPKYKNQHGYDSKARWLSSIEFINARALLLTDDY